MGDALLQKTYTVDFLSKKKVMNKGIVPQYYVEDDHEPIIPKELFYRVQEEKARRASVHAPATKRREVGAKVRYSSAYALSDIMVCGECGHPYRRQVWSKYGIKKAVWRCDSRLKNGIKVCTHSPTLYETALHEAVMTAINSVVEEQSEFVEAFRENVIRVIGSYQTSGVSIEYDEQLESLQRQMMALIEDSVKKECADEDFDQKYRVIADEIKDLKKKKRKQLRKNQLADAYEQRLGGMDGYMKKTNYLKRQFDDDLVRRLIQSIKVISESKIEIQFKSGIVMK